jgi:hypothetical protein
MTGGMRTRASEVLRRYADLSLELMGQTMEANLNSAFAASLVFASLAEAHSQTSRTRPPTPQMR